MTSITLEQAAAEPERYQICKNGAVRDIASGKFTGGDVRTKFDHSKSMAAHEIKRKQWEDNFTTGMAAHAAVAANGGGVPRAIQLIGANITKIAASGSDTAAVKAAAEVARLGGWVERAAGGGGTTVQVLNVVDGRSISQMIRDMRETDVIDVE